MVTNNSCDYQPTQYNVQTGGASGTLNNVAPSATSGVPVISQGASSQPVFGTAVVAGGGTGVTSTTAYAVLCGGTTSTGVLQSIASVGTSGQLLTSNGAGALPTFQAAAAGSGFTQTNLQVFSASGTYTPTASMKYCIVEAWGGGGAGGGSFANFYGGGGGAGGYTKGNFSAATIGASKTVTIGAAGTGSSGNDGGNGGNTTFGSTLLTANGGNGGKSAPNGGAGGTGGTASSGSLNITGATGTNSGAGASVVGVGTGAYSSVGGGGPSFTAGAGGAATGFAAGGGGGGGASTVAGGNGAGGLIVVTEFI